MTIHDAILTLLRTDPTVDQSQPFRVFEADAVDTDTDGDAKVVTVELPYVVYLPSNPIDGARVATGETTNEDLEFRLMFVGGTRAQASAAGDRAASRIRGRAPLENAGICRREGSQQIRREDTYTAPGGAPLFYGIDVYAVTV